MKRLLREMVLDYCAIEGLGVKIGLLLLEASAAYVAGLSIYSGFMEIQHSVLQAIDCFVSAGILLGAMAILWMALTYRAHMLREP